MHEYEEKPTRVKAIKYTGDNNKQIIDAVGNGYNIYFGTHNSIRYVNLNITRNNITNVSTNVQEGQYLVMEFFGTIYGRTIAMSEDYFDMKYALVSKM